LLFDWRVHILTPLKIGLLDQLTGRGDHVDKTELLLKELTETNGVSGHEVEIRRLMARQLKPITDSIQYDKIGSIMGLKKGGSDRPRVMLVAHMDEIGFIVREISSEGYIKVLPLGGWWGHVALGQRMRVMTSKGPVLGVVGSKPPHLLPDEERKKVIDIKDMFIDVGVQEKFDVKKRLGIKVGEPLFNHGQQEDVPVEGVRQPDGLRRGD
jgi:endoglucanase